MAYSYAASSGYGIASRALTAVMKAHDGRGPATMLTNSILQSLGLSSPDEIIGYLSRNSCPTYTFRLIVVRLFFALYRVIIPPTNPLLNGLHCEFIMFITIFGSLCARVMCSFACFNPLPLS